MAHAGDDHDQPTPGFPTSVDVLTPAWLTGALAGGAPGQSAPASVVDVRVAPLGTGVGLLGTLHRLDLTWSGGDGPAAVVVKAPAGGERSRQVAALFDMHRNEVRFYRDLAAATGVAVTCHHAEIDERTHDFLLVLDDMSGEVALDQLAGCPPDRAAAVVARLAELHARHWDGAGLDGAPWLRPADHDSLVEAFQAALRATWPDVRDRCADDLAAPVLAVGDRLESLVPTLMAMLARPPVTLVHGDARLDNMFFAGDSRVTLCDWQLTGTSRGVRDLAYFLTQSLSTADRAACEGELVDAYLARLAECGATGYDEAQAWEDYRAGTLLGLVIAVVAGGGLDQATARGEALTRTMLQRAAAAVVDHDCAALG